MLIFAYGDSSMHRKKIYISYSANAHGAELQSLLQSLPACKHCSPSTLLFNTQQHNLPDMVGSPRKL